MTPNAGGLALDVPERLLDPADRRHRHRAARPHGTPVERVPDTPNVSRILTDEVLSIGRGLGPYGPLFLLQAGLADAADAGVRVDPEKGQWSAWTISTWVIFICASLWRQYSTEPLAAETRKGLDLDCGRL